MDARVCIDEENLEGTYETWRWADEGLSMALAAWASYSDKGTPGNLFEIFKGMRVVISSDA